MARRTRMSLFLSAAVVALLCFAAFGAVAFAAPGDSPAHAYPLTGDTATSPAIPSVIGSSLTTDLVGTTSAGPDTSYYFKVLLTAGDALKGDFMSSPTTDAPDGINLKALIEPQFVGSARISSSLERLTFLAPTTSMYTVYVAASLPGTFAVAPTIVPGVPVSLTAPVASSSPNHKKAITFSGSVRPGHKARVTVTIQRKVSGKMKKYTSLALTSNAYGNWSFKLKLPAGTFQLRQSTAMVVGFHAATSKWRVVKVK
jgi:hypothetical protein